MRKETLIINGKELKISKLPLKFLEDNKEFLEIFEFELREYIFTTSLNNPYKALRRLWYQDIVTFNNFEFFYKKEGHLKIYNGNSFIFKTPEIGKYFKGTMRDKLRPEHGKMMSVKMKGIDRGDSFRKIKSDQNKSIYFKKTVLKNKGIDFSELDDDLKIKELYKNYLSEKNKSVQYRVNRVKKFLLSEKYKNEEIFNNFLIEYGDKVINEENYEVIFSKMVSVISTIAIARNKNMGTTKFFKKGIVEVNNCLNKTIISYRSGWELITINFLEANGIKYEYEPFYIQKELKGYYVPDFLIYLHDNKLLLEIKGFIRGKIGKLKEEEKIKAALKYCNERNINYVYLKEPLKNIEQLYGN